MRLGYDRRLCAEVLEAFVLELSRSLKRRAKQALDLATVAQATRRPSWACRQRSR